MHSVSRPLIIGNWKMNPGTKQSARRLFKDVQKGVARIRDVDVAVAPPDVFLSLFDKTKRPVLCAQNVHWEKLGPRMGEVSVVMFKDIGVKEIIVGHSDRRAAGETNEEVNKKIHTVLKEGLTAILCVGEQKRDTGARYFNFIEKQIHEACAGVAKTKMSQLVIAYEPIWAIGTGKNATPNDAHEMKIFIQKVLTHLYGRNVAMRVRILYGGSVNAKNAEALLTEGMVNGFLVGGASLRSEEFIEIIKIAHTHAR